MNSHVIVVGGTLAGVRAARRLADSGLTVTLLEPSPFLGPELPRGQTTWIQSVPDLLEATRDPRITVLTQAVVQQVTRQGGAYHLQVLQAPRYVDPERCTGCGECEAVCPVEPKHGQNGHRRRAIYREPPARSVPNVYVVEKRGDPPCTHSCPGGIHVQGYVALIAQGKFRQAHDLITQEIPFPGICGRVCYHPCEGECSRRELDQPIAVRSLKRFVADHVTEHNGRLVWDRVEPDPSLPPVAVIGAGPAGLTVAWALARQGVRVGIYEALPVAGGMMTAGIPAYRLPRDVLAQEIAAIEDLGVELHLNTALGSDVTVEGLLAQGYGAVFLGLGAHRSRALGVPGEELAGVVQAIDLLRAVSLAQHQGVEESRLPQHLQQSDGIAVGRRALVVGGGNTAVDAARTLLRLGAEEVTILYRRSRREMPALPEEIDAAEQEGIVLQTLAAPLGLLGQAGRVSAVECVRMELGEPDESGRRRPLPIPGSEFVLEADMVVPAVGQEADLPALPEELCENGRLRVDPQTGHTPLPGVFAAGDVVRPATVIEAIGAAKRVAASILGHLRGEPGELPFAAERPVARWTTEELEGWMERTRQEPSVLPPQRRRAVFAEVEQVFTPEQAVIEASRCLSCAVCSECLECLKVCEPQAIQHSARPQQIPLQAEAVLLAGECDLSFPAGVIRMGEGDAEAAVEACLGALAGQQSRPALRPGRSTATASAPQRLGVFLCRCGEQIAKTLALDALQGWAAALPGVVRVEQIPFACLPEGIAALRRFTGDLDGAILAACSCCSLDQVCYSCTTQRVRCREGLGTWAEQEAGLPSWAWEYVNLREHCSWVHDARGAWGVARDAIASAAARLIAGPIVPRTAAVDAARCRACGTCQTLCQAEAIRLETDESGRTWARVEESRCLACGTCAAHCPTGAVAAGRISDRQMERTVEVLLASGEDERVVVYTCNWGGHSGAELAGMAHRALPNQLRTVRIPCLGRLSAGMLLQTLERGAAGVLLVGCTEDGCRYDFGRGMAAEAFAQAQALAELLGLPAERLGMVGLAAGDGMGFVREVERFVGQLQQAAVPCPR